MTCVRCGTYTLTLDAEGLCAYCLADLGPDPEAPRPATPGEPEQYATRPAEGMYLGWCSICQREGHGRIPATYMWKGTSLCERCVRVHPW